MSFTRKVVKAKQQNGVIQAIATHSEQLKVIDNYLQSLEQLLVSKGIVTQAELDSIADAAVNGYAVSPPQQPAELVQRQCEHPSQEPDSTADVSPSLADA